LSSNSVWTRDRRGSVFMTRLKLIHTNSAPCCWCGDRRRWGAGICFTCHPPPWAPRLVSAEAKAPSRPHILAQEQLQRALEALAGANVAAGKAAVAAAADPTQAEKAAKAARNAEAKRTAVTAARLAFAAIPTRR